jgi:hypothetical protein
VLASVLLEPLHVFTGEDGLEFGNREGKKDDPRNSAVFGFEFAA